MKASDKFEIRNRLVNLVEFGVGSGKVFRWADGTYFHKKTQFTGCRRPDVDTDKVKLELETSGIQCNYALYNKGPVPGEPRNGTLTIHQKFKHNFG